MSLYRLGWFSTGRDAAACDLLKAAVDAIQGSEIKANIEFVLCSREPGESKESDRFIEQVRGYGIPLICFSYQRYKGSYGSNPAESGFPSWRLDYDREVMRLLQPYNPELCVLAGYMLIVSPELCTRYNMLNLHPAAPGGPTGTWQEVVWQIIEQKAKQSGVMMHLVTPELDRGPVASYCLYNLRGESFDPLWWQYEGMDAAEIRRAEGEANPLFQAIRAEGLKREFPLIISSIKAFSQHRVRIEAGKILDAHGKIIHGYDLSREIDLKITNA